MTAYSLILLEAMTTQMTSYQRSSIEHKKMPDTRKSDDGVFPYTPRSPDDADDVLQRFL